MSWYPAPGNNCENHPHSLHRRRRWSYKGCCSALGHGVQMSKLPLNWLNTLLGMSRSCAQWQGQKKPYVHPNFLTFPNGTTKTNYGFGEKPSILECRGLVLSGKKKKAPVHPNCLHFPNGNTKTNYGFGKGCFGDPAPVLEFRGFVLNDEDKKTSVHPNCLNFPQAVSPKPIMDLGKDGLATQRA